MTPAEVLGAENLRTLLEAVSRGLDVVAVTGSRTWIHSFPCSGDGCVSDRALHCFGRYGMHEERWAAASVPVETALRLLRLPSRTTIVHGAARGLDAVADRVARRLGFTVEARPANWANGYRAGPERNEKIIRLDKPGLVLAFNVGEHGTRGTNDMIARARKAGIPVVEVRR